MAGLECSYHRVSFCKVWCGVFLIATQLLQFASSAVSSCFPCRQGEFCETFTGFCLSCNDYCVGQNDCREQCDETKPSTMPPTSTPKGTTFHHLTSREFTEASPTFVVTYPDETLTQSGGGGAGGPNTFLSKDYLELPLELMLGLLLIGILIALAGWLWLNRKTLKKFINRCFKARDSQTNIELHEIHRNRRRSTDSGTIVNIWENPMDNLTHVRRPSVNAVQVTDEVSINVVNKPGPSGLNSSRSPRNRTVEARPTNSQHSAPGLQRTPAPVDEVHLFQSASVHPNNASSVERVRLLGAVPSDNQSGKQKTPETHRKITDGTHEGHICTTGASPFIAVPFEQEDVQWNHDSGHGD